VAAGVRTDDLAAAFAPRAIARAMPTTGVAVGKGAVSIFAHGAKARAAAHLLFDPVATTIDLADEALMDAAVAVSGSAPAYLYAFMEALAAAGVTEGLSEEAAKGLVRATIIGAAALLDRSDEDPADLRRKVASPPRRRCWCCWVKAASARCWRKRSPRPRDGHGSWDRDRGRPAPDRAWRQPTV
jgi:pyrroline-5-carboxylate reductase